MKKVKFSAGAESSQENTVAKEKGVTCYLDQSCSFSDSKNQRGGKQRSKFEVGEELSMLRRKCKELYGERQTNERIKANKRNRCNNQCADAWAVPGCKLVSGDSGKNIARMWNKRPMTLGIREP